LLPLDMLELPHCCIYHQRVIYLFLSSLQTSYHVTLHQLSCKGQPCLYMLVQKRCTNGPKKKVPIILLWTSFKEWDFYQAKSYASMKFIDMSCHPGCGSSPPGFEAQTWHWWMVLAHLYAHVGRACAHTTWV
jgi:hypothetical protein